MSSTGGTSGRAAAAARAWRTSSSTSGNPGGGIAKNLHEQELHGLCAATGAQPGDAIFFQAGPRGATLEALGALRLAAARDRGVAPDEGWDFLWIMDPPMFEPAGEGGGWTPLHHPFTRPRVEDAAALAERPGEALAIAYDVVLNGTEIGGGSLRIHERELQEKVFGVLGMSEEEARSKFGFLLEAFTFGPPPHGGIAFGWDRICMFAAAGGIDPRRDRLPEDSQRRRPAHRRADAHHRRPAPAKPASTSGPRPSPSKINAAMILL